MLLRCRLTNSPHHRRQLFYETHSEQIALTDAPILKLCSQELVFDLDEGARE